MRQLHERQHDTNGVSRVQDGPDAARQLAEEAAQAEASQHEVLILADHDAAGFLGQYAQNGAMHGAFLVEVDENGTFVPTSHWVGVGIGPSAAAMIAARKPAVTWCSSDYDGRTLARALHDSVTVEVRHITLTDPARWTGQGFEQLLKGASSVKPTPIPKPESTPGGAQARRQSEPTLDVSPGAIAARVIRKFGGSILIVAPTKTSSSDDIGKKTVFSAGYTLGDNGIWDAGGDRWVEWLAVIANEMIFEALEAEKDRVLSASSLPRVLASIQNVKRPTMVEQVRKMLRGTLNELRGTGEPCSDVTECHAEEIDANMRYIGAVNGVVDLHTGKGPLSKEEGSKLLVTVHTPVTFDPTARHSDVDKLFSHLDVGEKDKPISTWLWRVLGYHLMGSPSRRFYIVEGPSKGGKSTLANALEYTLGPYAQRPQDSALEVVNVSAGLNPEQQKFSPPNRIALFLEIAITRTSAEGIKRKSGDDSQTQRRPHREEVTLPISATMFWFCNVGTAPRLRLQDEALADRLRVIPYPSVPKAQQDYALIGRVKTDDGFKRALLARLVAAAAAEMPGKPPTEPPEVSAATKEKVREEIGEFGEFARRIVPGGTSLTVADVWSAWCEQCGVTEKESVAGITRSTLSRRLRDYVLGLPAAVSRKSSGKSARGWSGWKLLERDDPSLDPQLEASTTANSEVLQAKQDLLHGFPNHLSVLGRTVSIQLSEILGKLDEAELLALHRDCQNGPKLAEKTQIMVEELTGRATHTKVWTGQVFLDAESELKNDRPDLTAEERAREHVLRAISHLAWKALYTEVGGPVLEQARDRQTDLWSDIGFIALGAVEVAVRKLGPEAESGAVAWEAHKLVADCLASTTEEEREGYGLEEVAAAIDQLVGSLGAPHGIIERVKAGQGPANVLLKIPGLAPSGPISGEENERNLF